jgi:hypothetical protein
MRSFSVYPAPTRFAEFASLPEALPEPVRRHFGAVLGDQVPVITSAVLTGRAEMRLKGLTLPARFRMVHDAGRSHRHYFEVVVLGQPIFKINEWNLDGKARLELPVGVVDDQPKTNSAASLGMWAEQLSWLPSVFMTDPRVRWDAVDQNTARAIVPSPEGEDAMTLGFDPATGLLHTLDALRWREETDTAKLPWHGEVLGWSEFHGIKVANPSTLTWVNDGKPWAIWHIEDAAYNVDVSDYIRASGA